MLSNFSFQAVHNRQVIKINKNDFHLPTVNSRHTLDIYLYIIAETSYNDHFSGVASHVNCAVLKYTFEALLVTTLIIPVLVSTTLILTTSWVGWLLTRALSRPCQGIGGVPCRRSEF